MSAVNNMNIIKSEKKLVETTLNAIPGLQVWTVQFRNNCYTVNVKHYIPQQGVANPYYNLTNEHQTYLENLMKTLNLTYPVKIIGGGDRGDIPNGLVPVPLPSPIVRLRLRCKRPVVAKPRRMEQSIFKTIVEMAYEMDKAEHDYYLPVTRVQNVMKEVFNEHYPEGRRLPVPKVVTDKKPKHQHGYTVIADDRNQSQTIDYQETDTPTKWSKRFYLPSITVSRRVEQIEDNVWKITPYIFFTGKVVFANNQLRRGGHQWRSIPNQPELMGWLSQWVASDTYQKYGYNYTVGIAYTNKSQAMEAFNETLKLYTSWLRDARDVNSLEQLEHLEEYYREGIIKDAKMYECSAH